MGFEVKIVFIFSSIFYFGEVGINLMIFTIVSGINDEDFVNTIISNFSKILNYFDAFKDIMYIEFWFMHHFTQNTEQRYYLENKSQKRKTFGLYSKIYIFINITTSFHKDAHFISFGFNGLMEIT